MQSIPLWTPTGWTALFMAINLYHITRILLERRPVKFSPDEQRLYDLAFRNFEPRDSRKLLKAGNWGAARRGGAARAHAEALRGRAGVNGFSAKAISLRR